MNGKHEVADGGTHLDGKGSLGDYVSCIDPCNAHAEYPFCFLIRNDFGDPVIAPQGGGTS